MEILGERPVWSMSDSVKLSTLDAVFAEEARLKTIKLQLVADLEQSGYAKEIGAGDTARLMSERYRIDPTEARRDVSLANALVKHPATAAALPDPATPFANPATVDRDDPAASDGWRVHPAQAEAIVSVLAKVPNTVPIENVEFAERKLIDLAATLTPAKLRQAGKKIRDILDPDGPEPDEKKAYARESLTLRNADQGVNFRGFLANENAELFRTLIHTHARPHKTLDIQILDGVVHVARPTWATPDPIPRTRYRPPSIVTPPPAASTPPVPPPHAHADPTNPPQTTALAAPSVVPWADDTRPPKSPSTPVADQTACNPGVMPARSIDPTHVAAPPSVNPWGDDDRPTKSSGTPVAAPPCVDPWSDASGPTKSPTAPVADHAAGHRRGAQARSIDPTHTAAATSPSVDPWGDDSDPTKSPGTPVAAPPCVDPWSDASVPTKSSGSPVADQVSCNPWGDDSLGLPVAGVRHISTASAATVDPWSDAANMNTAAS